MRPTRPPGLANRYILPGYLVALRPGIPNRPERAHRFRRGGRHSGSVPRPSWPPLPLERPVEPRRLASSGPGIPNPTATLDPDNLRSPAP